MDAPNPKISNKLIRSKKQIDDLFTHWLLLGASDFTIKAYSFPFIQIAGKLEKGFSREFTKDEVEYILSETYAKTGVAKLNSGEDIDYSYVLIKKGVRFRVNAISILAKNRQAIEISFRVLASEPPRLEELAIEKPLLKALMPVQGLILVTGPTGSGKTTLLASVCKERLETSKNGEKICTYEHPIEYTYDAVKLDNCVISQSEIPTHIPSFSLGIRNALRRNPTAILVGEARDHETIKATLEAAETGHAVYTTIHTNGVLETIFRIQNKVQDAYQSDFMSTLISNLQVIVSQRLITTKSGKLVGVREFLVFDDVLKSNLLKSPQKTWLGQLATALNKKGQSFMTPIQTLFDNGEISEKDFLKFKASFLAADLNSEKRAA